MDYIYTWFPHWNPQVICLLQLTLRGCGHENLLQLLCLKPMNSCLFAGFLFLFDILLKKLAEMLTGFDSFIGWISFRFNWFMFVFLRFQVLESLANFSSNLLASSNYCMKFELCYLVGNSVECEDHSFHLNPSFITIIEYGYDFSYWLLVHFKIFNDCLFDLSKLLLPLYKVLLFGFYSHLRECQYCFELLPFKPRFCHIY